MDATEPIDVHLISALRAMGDSPDETTPAAESATDVLRRMFDAQAASRQVDFAARELRARDEGFYTISSAGHESNALVAEVLRPTDPALLHYRSGGFYLARAGQVPGIDGVRDLLASLAASTEDPISGGRHKVIGRKELAIIPQTSTISSHLPRALGVAFSIARSKKLGVQSEWPTDAITVCSFGDASANHSTALGAINAACHASYQGLPIPLLLVCEDNGVGISVPTPSGWIARTFSGRDGLRYFHADGAGPVQALAVSQEAADYVRRTRKPAFLHLSVVRFMAHAGSDAELSYRTPAQIEADYDRDPLLATGRALVDTGTVAVADLLSRYEYWRDTVADVAEEVIKHPRLRRASTVMAAIAPRNPAAVSESAATAAVPERRSEIFGGRLPEAEGPMTLSMAINRTLVDVMAANPKVIVFGEDVGRKGGVYGVTQRLQKRFGSARVFDTILDEQTVLGLGLGTAVSGLVPIPEIQYLAYLHNAEDQLRGEAATLQFFSAGQYSNGMVVRIAGLGYQKGFGGHFHNDNSVAALRDIPGLVVAVPSRADDAAAMLRTCIAAADLDGTVTAFIEPIALYHSRDVFEAGDDDWLCDYADPSEWQRTEAPIGIARVYLPTDRPAEDLTLITFGNGVPMSLRVASRLIEEGVGVRIVDLRWLNPLPVEDIVREAQITGRVLVVDETRASGGVSESVITCLTDAEYGGQIARVTSRDSFIPLGAAANLVMLDEESIETAARQLLEGFGASRG